MIADCTSRNISEIVLDVGRDAVVAWTEGFARSAPLGLQDAIFRRVKTLGGLDPEASPSSPGKIRLDVDGQKSDLLVSSSGSPDREILKLSFVAAVPG